MGFDSTVTPTVSPQNPFIPRVTSRQAAQWSWQWCRD
jgi:hypothetical protein